MMKFTEKKRKIRRKTRMRMKHEEVAFYCHTLRGFVHRTQQFAILPFRLQPSVGMIQEQRGDKNVYYANAARRFTISSRP